jgi:hypothetical protein
MGFYISVHKKYDQIWGVTWLTGDAYFLAPLYPTSGTSVQGSMIAYSPICIFCRIYELGNQAVGNSLL